MKSQVFHQIKTFEYCYSLVYVIFLNGFVQDSSILSFGFVARNDTCFRIDLGT